MAVSIFDGKGFAEKIALDLQIKYRQLDRQPVLAAIVDRRSPAAAKYTDIKKKMAGRLGIKFVEVDNISEAVEADGIIIQLPHPDFAQLVEQIPADKDVDGLKPDSKYRPAVVSAVLAVLAEAKRRGLNPIRLAVVGANGFVGSKMIKALDCDGLDLGDSLSRLKDYDTVISCTGEAGLIRADMVKNGVVAIDVGYPQGDFDSQVAKKAAFFTPVPGGVGPVTVAMLFANLLDAVS